MPRQRDSRRESRRQGHAYTTAKGKNISAKQSPTVDMHKAHDYKLYAINFHGSALNSIREEFRERVLAGERRRIFVIDLEEEEKILATKVRNTKRFDDFAVALESIERCRNEYTTISKIIAEEKTFNLISFWMDNLYLPTGDVLPKKSSTYRQSAHKSSLKLAKSSEKITRGNEKLADKGSKASKIGLIKKKSVLRMPPVCPNLAPKRSNKVGRPESLSKKRYIQDEPEDSQLFIVLIGDMDNEFYIKLLSRNEPLQAIVHFLPDECGYDLLLPHPENKEMLARTIEEIQIDIFEMRSMAITKEIGYLQHYLPVISRCLAKKYSQQIFDELSHYLYDIELLRQQYALYYIQPFQITNVQMPAHVDVETLREIVESLALQGTYLTKQLPAMTSDRATIIIYFEGLLNQIAQRARKLTPEQAQLVKLPYRESSQLALSVDLRDVYTTAFESIMKVKQFERICVAANNLLLRELLLFTNTESFMDIHYTTLEYNSLCTYTANMCLTNMFQVQAFDEFADHDFIPLPYYAQMFYGENIVKQNLEKWLNECSTCVVEEIMPDCRLYHFKRVYNEVSEVQQVTLLPSRLCFRDFTLFQVEEFLEALVTPEMLQTRYEQQYSSMHTLVKEHNEAKFNKDIDMSIFIRPTSLKWQEFVAYFEKERIDASDGKITNIPQLQSILTQKSIHSTKESIGKTGLPKDHPLLQGYNLEDIRQEIQTKTCKYYFEEGGIELYEERWCFTDMNKNLVFNVNNKTFNIFRPRFWNTAVSSCLRFANENEVVVRVLNKESECAKVVINYPNGLAIYHNGTYAEQEWYTDETVNREQRRIFDAQGAVIVHYQSADMILVMRYNGEVYRLYQYEFPTGEEEEGFNEMTEDLSSSLKIELKDSTVNKGKETTRRTQRDSKEKEAAQEVKELPETKRKSARAKEVKSTRKDSVRASKTYNEATSRLSVVLEDTAKPKTLKERLVESIDNELRFLNEISMKYGLTYLHLIVTTSVGYVINLTHKGKVYKGRSDPTLEWHDYFANESYAQRGDGVRMIWTEDALKCYHADGTLIVTKLAEKIIFLEYDTATPFTMSSSHMEEDFVGGESDAISTSRVLVDGVRSKGSAVNPPKDSVAADTKHAKKSLLSSPSTHTRSRVFSTISNYVFTGEGEEARYDDPSYVAYRYDTFNILHKRYAAVKFELYEVPLNDIVVSIMAIDGICAYVYKVVNVIGDQPGDEYTEIPNFTTTLGDSVTGNSEKLMSGIRRSGSKTHSTHTDGTEVHTTIDADQNTEDDELIVKTVVKVSFGNDFSVTSTEEACEMVMDLERYDKEQGKMRDNLELHFNYVQNITDLFQYFVDEISKFKNYQKAQSKHFYFLEHQNEECNTIGYRFVCHLPKPTEYNFAASNTFIELKRFKNIQELMSNEYPLYDADMKKFPRFRYKRERVLPIKDTFPFVLKTNIFVKIPTPLCNTSEIYKFLAPIDNFNFKSTQRFLKEALEYHLRPRIRTELAKLWSYNNWKIKLEEHKQRIFREQQRTVLYQAMLKHKVFPKYHQFDYTCNGHVRNIDFFGFIINRCTLTPEQVEAERLAEQKRLDEENRLKKMLGKSREPSTIQIQEPPAPPKEGLRHRRWSRYRGEPRPKCVTTISHISDQVKAD